MSATVLKIWYNTENPDSTGFVNFLGSDLQKCLTRFGVSAEIDPDHEKYRYCFSYRRIQACEHL